MRLVWSRKALGDLDQIEAYYRNLNPRAGARMWRRIVERVAAQLLTPYAAPLEDGGPTRRLVVTRTPYLVLYRIVDDELRVEAVFHAAQNR